MLLKIHKLSYFLKNENCCLYLSRKFLSPAYACTNLWNERLQTPLLKPIKMDDFTFQILQRHEREKYISAIDLDIFCNKSDTSEHADIIKDILPKFRKMIPPFDKYTSTHCAVCRLFLSLNMEDDLLELLGNHIKYDVHPDAYSANILMNHFINKSDGKKASQIVYNLMLGDNIYPCDNLLFKHHGIDIKEENITSNVTPYLAMFSLLLHYEHNYKDHKTNLEPKPVPVKVEEPIEYKRVAYLKKYFYDDHFDIKKFEDDPEKVDRLLLGKSLVHLSDLTINDNYFNNIIGRSALIIGLCLWRKFDKVLSTLKKYVEEDTEPAVTKEAIDCIDLQFEAFAREIEEIRKREIETSSKRSDHLPVFDYDQPPKFELPYDLDTVRKECKDLTVQLQHENKVSKLAASLIDIAKIHITSKVKEFETADIDSQTKLFEKWILDRETNLENQIKEHFKGLKLKEIAEARKSLEEEEKVITFFDREKEIEMLIDKTGKIRELIRKKNAPPPGPGEEFIYTSERIPD